MASDTEPKAPLFGKWGWKEFIMLGTVASGFIGASYAVLSVATPYIRSDPPPYASISRVQQFTQNFQTEQRTIAEQLRANGQFTTAVALTVYSAQLQQAIAQIEIARLAGKRDLAAEALKASAEQAIMSITAQAVPAQR